MDSEATAAAVKKYMFDHNILVNIAHGKTLRLMPPLIFTMDQKDKFMNVFKEALKQ
jgi:acetylornithine aminotransferase/acetylornithine/N-succinyldiaminopimelate aminotransferase